MSGIDPKSFDNHTVTGDQAAASNISVSYYPTSSSISQHGSGAIRASTASNPSLGSTAAQNSNGWKLVTALFCLTTIIAAIGWTTTNDKKNRALSDASSYSANASSASSRSDQLQRALDEERSKRVRIAEAWPLTITEIKLTSSGQPVQSIYWEVTLKNNFAGDKTLTGELYIKYLQPDGNLIENSSSPSGFTQSKSVSVDGITSASSGLGYQTGGNYDRGTYRVQFWWDGRIIGEKSFTVY